jgi:molybdate transport system substrate-binding protein
MALLVAWGCAPANSGDSVQSATVTIFAAASAQNALQDIADRYKRENKIQITIIADDSARLALQIENGAPADLFLSANQRWAQHLAEKGFSAQTKPLLGNELVLIVPHGNPASIEDFADVLSPQVTQLALAGGKVPAGMYGRQALSALQLLTKLEQQNKLALGENVRSVLTYVERGEATAGIVYRTDALLSQQVEVVAAFPAELHDEIVYPLVLLKAGASQPQVVSFFEHLQAAEAGKIFEQHGFKVLARNAAP